MLIDEASCTDIATSNKTEVVVLELTVFHESNSEKSRTYKKNKYKHLHQNLKLNIPRSNLRVFTLEITVLAKFDISEFSKFAKLPTLLSTLSQPSYHCRHWKSRYEYASLVEKGLTSKHSLVSSVIMSSYNIYRSRISLN